MKLFKKVVVILALLNCGTVMAQGDVLGTWQGEMSISPELDLTVQFIISDAGGGNFSVLINSPDNQSINNLAASAVDINGNSLSLEFDSLSGAFNGDLAEGTINGEWTQLSDSFPLILTPYIESELSATELELLVGSWFGEIEPPDNGNVMNVVFNFELDDEGALSGSLEVPAQGVTGIGLADFVMANSQFSFTVPQAQARYEGQFTEAGIEGTWMQGGQEISLIITKGEYVAENNTVFNLTEADKEVLLGHWTGQMGPLTLVLRFELDDNGDFISLVDSPVQNATGLPVTEVTFINGELKVVLALGAEFNGELNGEEIVGTWAQGGMTNPLTLTKGEYVPQDNVFNLTEAEKEVLMGRWSGELGPLTIVLRFERDNDGEFISFVDSPAQNATDLAVTEVTLSGNQLKVVLALGAEFNGEMNGNEIAGAWSQGGMSNPLTVTKE